MNNESLIYFAYGSNMYTNRLQTRVGKVEERGIAYLENYQLRFNKSGQDGSGKCNIIASKDKLAKVWGVLFCLNKEQKVILDKYESVGHGYADIEISVYQEQQKNQYLPIRVFVYEALEKALLDENNDTIKPFHWYKDFVCYGAREHHLPKAYIQQIEAIVSVEDPNTERRQSNAKILAKKSGCMPT